MHNANMNALIRQENSADHKSVFKVISAAFKNVVHTDHKEQYLVKRLRSSDAFIPQLSLVANVDGRIVGHVLLTRIIIRNDMETFNSLALAPVSVLPDYQNQGIGGKLIITAHQKAKQLGYTSVILIGHDSYYPRFGYLPAHTFGIELPFEAPLENCMACELIPGALSEVTGTVAYAKAFYE